jgi:preprotein translocase subunit SecE
MMTLKELTQRVRQFFAEVAGEVKKCSWPERQELIESTVLIIFTMVMLSVFVGISDKVLVTVIRLIIRAG